MKHVRMLTAAALAALTASAALAGTVKQYNATNTANAAVDQSNFEAPQGSGRPVTIVNNVGSMGLIALASGMADAAIVSEPLDMALSAAKLAGTDIDASKLKVFEIRKDEIVFVVNPKNQVSALTKEQLKDIHTGKITNWKTVGGKDLPITVYSEAADGATRLIIKKVVMDGSDYGSEVKAQTAVIRVAQQVAKDEGGIGGIVKDFVDEKSERIIQTQKVERPFNFVTMGEPSDEVKQMIEDFRAQAGK